jgi:Protein of unknown function (DUF1549)/Protein of unknown function (DUF1553)
LDVAAPANYSDSLSALALPQEVPVSRWHVVVALVGGLLALAPSTWAADGDDPAKGAALTARIDRALEGVWKAKDARPAEAAGDAEFFRRVHLDLAGCIPAAADVRSFLADARPDKRRRCVDDLLAGPGYVRHQTNLWRDQLLPPANGPQVPAWRTELEAWLRQQFRDDVTPDRLARALLTAPLTFDPTTPNGRPDRPGEPSPLPFYRANELKPESLAAAVSRTFLGVQLDCAQCHDHPFGPWKRRQFAEFAAFFAAAKPTRLQAGRVAAAVEDVERRSFALPGAEPVSARFLDGASPRWVEGSNPRAVLADWMTAADNPYFARHAVNRLWAQLFGAELAGSADDPFADLLAELAREFAADGYDLKRLTRAVLASRAYQLGSAGDAPAALFARMRVRGLSADQMHDSLARAAGFRDGEHAALRADFLARFQQAGERAADRQPSVLQVLTLMNGPLVDEAVNPERGRTLAAVAEAPWLDTAGRVEALFLASLSRPPTRAERDRYAGFLDKAGTEADRRRRLGDVFWALLNSSEFILNH